MSKALKNSIDQWYVISDKSDVEVVNLIKSLYSSNLDRKFFI